MKFINQKIEFLISIEVLRFCLAGVFYYCASAIIMFLCYNLCDYGYWKSSMIAFAVVSFGGFFISKNKVFRNNKPYLAMLLKFIVCVGLVYFISFWMVKFIGMTIIGTSKGFSISVIENGLMLISSVVFTIFNYILQKYVVFR